jgi:hypothetical protein
VRSCILWQEGVLIRDETQIRLPEGKASGPYRLAVAFSADGHDLVPAQSPQIIEWREDDGSTSRGAVLGMIDVPAFFESIPKLTGSVLDARFAQNIALETAAVTIGPVTNAEVSGDRRFIARLQSGDEISADLLWRSIADVSVDYSVFAHLIGPTDAIVAQDDLQPSVSNFPTSVWYPGEKRIDSVQVLVPPSIEPGVYRLVTGLYNRDDQVRLGVASGGIPGDQVLLGRFKVEGNDQTFGKPFSGEPRQALLAGTIALDGSALSSTDFRPGGKLSVGLIWKAIQRPMTDYTVFVHILDETDHVVAQVDSFPLGGTFETSDWDIGDTIYDSRDISLPTDLKSGTYSVEVGLYDAASGTRLTTATGDTSIRFGSLVVVGH